MLLLLIWKCIYHAFHFDNLFIFSHFICQSSNINFSLSFELKVLSLCQLTDATKIQYFVL